MGAVDHVLQGPLRQLPRVQGYGAPGEPLREVQRGRRCRDPGCGRGQGSAEEGLRLINLKAFSSINGRDCNFVATDGGWLPSVFGSGRASQSFVLYLGKPPPPRATCPMKPLPEAPSTASAVARRSSTVSCWLWTTAL